MVNIPGTSKRCKQCSVRRVKCDLGQPSCTRCLKSGIKCSGPTAGSVFVHRDVNNIHRVSDRKMLSHAFQNRHLDITTLPTATIKELHGSAQSNKLIAPISIPSSLGCSMDLYRSAVADLWIVTCHPATIPIDQNVESPMSSSAREILPLAFGSKTLDSALFAVATMFMGKLRSDSKLQGLALAAYPPALSRFRSELALGFGSKTNQTNKTVRAIAIALTLLFYEWLANGSKGEGYRFHLNGALDLIKNSGPEALESPITKAAYTDLRCGALGEALKSRKATFLASDQWFTITNKLSIKNHRQLLLDIVAHIPGLLERGDQLKLLGPIELKDAINLGATDECCHQNARSLQTIQYFGDCDSIIRKLHCWLKSLEESEGGRVWWYSDEKNPDQNCQQRRAEKSNEDIYSSTIHFSNPWIPGVVIYYWSSLLELSSTILEVRQLMNHNSPYAPCLGVLSADSPSLFMRLETVNEFAIHLCQTVIHLSSTLEGCTMSHIPAELAEQYFTRLLSTNDESLLQKDVDYLKNREKAYSGLQLCRKGLDILRCTVRT
ncbi:hypothetical protein HDV62DRAFT_352746 [Trichoderma sp. SZMC 28011]